MKAVPLVFTLVGLAAPGLALADLPPATATAFAVRADGIFLTNHHSTVGCRRLTLDDGAPLEVAHRDRLRDLAVLRARIATPVYLRFRERPAELGEPVSLLGFPFHGRTYASGLNLTNGIITSTSVRIRSTLIQTNAALQPGESGGPLLDEGGLVIGVAVSAVNERKVRRQTGISPQLMNFAVRGEEASAFLREAGLAVEIATPGGRLELRDVARQAQTAVRPLLCHR